jgi:hypothetical protein
MRKLLPISDEQLKADMSYLFGNPRPEPSTMYDLINALGDELNVVYGILGALRAIEAENAFLLHGAQELVEAHIERMRRLGRAACRIDQAQRSVA